MHGKAIAPSNAPWKVQKVIAAANRIRNKPYKWGGGHGRWNDSGYDCSGLRQLRAPRRPSARKPARLERLHALGAWRQGPVDHASIRTRPRVHGHRGTAVRHLDDGRQRPRLEQEHPRRAAQRLHASATRLATSGRARPSGQTARGGPVARGSACAELACAVRAAGRWTGVSGEPPCGRTVQAATAPCGPADACRSPHRPPESPKFVHTRTTARQGLRIASPRDAERSAPHSSGGNRSHHR